MHQSGCGVGCGSTSVAAQQAPAEGPKEVRVALDWVWRMLLAGRFYVTHTYYEGDLSYALLERRSPASTPPREVSFRILERVLRAEQPKCVGDELSYSTSTISHHCSLALSHVGGERFPSRVSALILMAVHAATGEPQPPARLRRLGPGSALLLSAPTPGQALREHLSASEWEVARLTIEGRSQAEISGTRGTSLRTTANQLASIYQKLNISGKAELRAVATCGARSRLRRMTGRVDAAAPDGKLGLPVPLTSRAPAGQHRSRSCPSA